jgi:hypothetical protein
MELLLEALCAAYDQESLDQMLRLRLNKDRTHIVGSGAFRAVLFGLIRVALMEGWLPDLVRESYGYNPGNPVLKRFYADYLNQAPAEPGAGSRQADRLREVNRLLTEFYRPVLVRLQWDNINWRRLLDLNHPDNLRRRVAESLEANYVLPNHQEVVGIIQRSRPLLQREVGLGPLLDDYIRHVSVYQAIRASGDLTTLPLAAGAPWPERLFPYVEERTAVLELELQALTRAQPPPPTPPAISPDEQRALTGDWRAEVHQEKGPGGKLFEQVIRFHLSASPDGIRGSFVDRHDAREDRFTVTGTLILSRFVMLDCQPEDSALVQFSRMVFERSPDFTALRGQFVGFGAITNDLISGSIVLTKRA